MKIQIDGKDVSALESATIKHGVKLVRDAVKRQLDKTVGTMPSVEAAVRSEYNAVNALLERLVS